MIRSSSTVQAIYRYPVKGFSPESLIRTSLTPGETIAGDRIYAIENGPSGFDSIVPVHLPKVRFLTLMRNERLAALQTLFNEASNVLAVHFDGREVARGNLGTAEGRAEIEEFIARHCVDELRGPPKVLYAPGHSFSDVESRAVSVINLASVVAIENAVGAPVNPLRFRGNVYVKGWPAWHEFDLIGREIGIGPSARVKIIKRIQRCAAIDVDPDTGIRDLMIPRALMRAFGNNDCGVYGKVVSGGEIAVGSLVTTVQ